MTSFEMNSCEMTTNINILVFHKLVGSLLIIMVVCDDTLLYAMMYAVVTK